MTWSAYEKATTVEAVQVKDPDDLPDDDRVEATRVDDDGLEWPEISPPNGFAVDTLEGRMLATFGDYLVRGVDGELYPVKQSIFERTYEEVES